MSCFTDQKPRVATAEDLRMPWGGGAPGERFRCYLCGHRFAVGDEWRWVFTNGTPGAASGNPIVCAKCDGPDVVERWTKHAREAETRFWWFL